MSSKPLRIFNVAWHVGAQHELYKLPNTHWTQIENHFRKFGGRTMMRDKPEKYVYDAVSRPDPATYMGDRFNRVAYYEKGKYDIAILHVDQQCIDKQIGKAQLFQQLFSEITDIPKIVLNHGTPVWVEGGWENEQLVEEMKKMLGNVPMVVNCEDAAKMWGWGTPIYHGLDPADWWDLPKEPRIITAMSPAGFDIYYNRLLMHRVIEILRETGIRVAWFRVNQQSKSFNDYRETLARSLIYIDTSLYAPMNRARTEAMLSGCAIVSLPAMNYGDFVEDGVSASLSKNQPEDFASRVKDLFDNPEKALAMGKAGREVATKEFTLEKYHNKWRDVINSALGEERL